MKFCRYCGKEVRDEAVMCVSCGCPTDLATQQTSPDQTSYGLCVLSFFIPLFGIIYWLIARKDTPKKAKACGVTALISWGVNILLILLTVFFAIMADMYIL